MNKSYGFSLIELLAVIAIVIILSATGMAIYSNIQKDARDQRRIRDLRALEQALEYFRNKNGYYPDASGELSGVLSTAISSYLESFPQDPIAGRNYQYKGLSCSASRCTSFTICAIKEGSKLTDLPCGDTTLVCGVGNCNMGISSK